LRKAYTELAANFVQQSEALSKLFVTKSDKCDVSVAVQGRSTSKAYLLYMPSIKDLNVDGPVYAIHAVGPESAVVLLATWQLARELGMVPRQVYVAGRALIAELVWRGYEGRRAARFRLTAASRSIEIKLQRPRPSNENMFCNIRWNKRRS
jgi:hypothetical protein